MGIAMRRLLITHSVHGTALQFKKENIKTKQLINLK
jgi:hypothetical protein